MGILSFEKIKKARSTAEHNSMFQADGAVPGVYVPNMSQEDSLKWKAKHIHGKDERIEIRKTLRGDGCYAQMLMVIYKDRNGKGPATVISNNGKMLFTLQDWTDLQSAFQEACDILGVKFEGLEV